MPSLDRVETFRNSANSNFLRLSEALPLRSPLFIHIDPTNLCNFRCRFCPTGDRELLKSVERPAGKMDLGLYRRLVDGISEFEDRLRVLSLYKDGEPLLHRELGGMIAYAKKREVADSIEIVTNGALLTGERAVELIESGLDQIKISVEHVHDRGYEEITRTKVKYGLIRSNVEFFFNEKEKRKSPMKIHAKIIDTDLTELERKSFLRDFNAISDTINIDSLMGWSRSDLGDFTLGKTPTMAMNRAGSLNRDITVCPRPFITMAVNFNGLVSVCCVDWSHGTVVGDGTRETLRQIWDGKRYNALRRAHLRGNRKSIGPCGKCQYIEGTDGISNIDHCAESLLECYPE